MFTRSCSLSLGCRNGGSQPDVVFKNLLSGKKNLKISQYEIFQALVDSRDADDLPMELETLRVTDESSSNKRDVKV